LRILLTNDDGVEAAGIEALVRVLSPRHTVVVAAPAFEQSGMSHAITVKRCICLDRYRPLEENYGVTAYRIEGTPADCVKLYLEAISADIYPEYVISGINHGANLGTDVLYSGTANAAMEAYLHGITATAASPPMKTEDFYDKAGDALEENLTSLFYEEGKVNFYNVNFPRQFCEGGPPFGQAVQRQLLEHDGIQCDDSYRVVDFAQRRWRPLTAPQNDMRSSSHAYKK